MRNDKVEISTDAAEIQKTQNYQQLYANKSDNLEQTLSRDIEPTKTESR